MPPPSDQNEHAPGRPDAPVNCFAPHAPATLRLALRADLVSASIAREKLAGWLRAHAWPPAHVQDLVLVVSEAVSNSIEHGYGVGPTTYGHPGVVRVTADVVADRPGFRHVRLVVADDGAWREPVHGIEPGRGLDIIRTLAAEATVEGTPHGTTLTFRGRPNPAP